MEWRCWPYVISTDKSLLDFTCIHGYLSQSYWSTGISRTLVERAANGSMCFGIYSLKHSGAEQNIIKQNVAEQIGYARVITDGASFAYLADVFVLENYRGQGLSKWLMHCIDQHPQLQGLRRFMLATRDAHGLYEQYGFTTVTDSSTLMMRHAPDIYLTR